jgi:predicted DNA-binding transcriptional regulator AlpA
MGPQLAKDLATRYGAAEFIPARIVWERYGITSMSLHRWLINEDLNFPRPLMIGRFRYWRLEELLAWESTRPRGQKSAAA